MTSKRVQGSEGDLARGSLHLVEQMFARYLADPQSVSESWQSYFAESQALEADLEEQHAADPAAVMVSVDGPRFDPGGVFSPPSAERRGSGNGSVSSRLPAPPPSASAARRPSAVGTSLSAQEVEQRVGFLRQVRLFDGIPPTELEQIAHLAGERRFSDGELVFRQAQAGTSLYVLTAGHLLVRRHDNVIATLNPGEVVGELSFLDSDVRSADVLAYGEVVTLRIERDQLLELMQHRPLIMRGFVEMLASRLRQRSSRQDKVNQLIHAYRVRGHLLAELDPLGRERPAVPELELSHWGLEERDLDSLFSSTTIAGTTILTLREILDVLHKAYCRSIGVQFMHIDDVHRKHWLKTRLEDSRHEQALDRDQQLKILTKLTDAEIFEQFIHKKFLGAKRFSLEGAETLIPLLDLTIDAAGSRDVDEIVIGMAHRGRLNVLVNILGKSPEDVFREFADDDADADQHLGRGDVKYHLGYSRDVETTDGSQMHLSLCFNPSHLEFVNPVVVGRVRAKQDRFEDSRHERCLGIIIHGDAAFAGQGVAQEMFNLSDLGGYRTGGTVHIIVNNQIGFTTPPESGRSTGYATDVARMLQTPIFHVNGESPEAVAHVVRLAMDYRKEFRQDVIIDMYCYRRYGHNEGDEPSYTQPLLYETIRKRKSVREGYLDRLLELREVTREDAEEIKQRRQNDLETELSRSRTPRSEYRRGPNTGEGLWQPYVGGADADVPEVATTIESSRAAELLSTTSDFPSEFSLNRKLKRFFDARRAMAAGDRRLDWGAAETVAFASLATDGHRVRLSGQDCGRGTFSHRHAIVYDTRNGKPYLPLQHVAEDQAEVHIWDSPLSEIGVLGYEYGYSLDTPDGLVVWEAQFGDFCNVAQVIIDQFITSSEDKWRRLSGLVMLLPHGFEGQGPEHSSARLERFLSLAAEDNIQVVNLTTPAQYFHCLRRQVLRPIRKPLVVMSPKSLLRHPEATSSLEELSESGFQRVIPDSGAAPEGVERILLTSGKLYYELDKARREHQRTDLAIIRIEQYYPLPASAVADALAGYSEGTPVVWVQEEPRNMGAWSSLRPRLEEMLAERWPLSCISRPESASPATGSGAAHRREQELLIWQALG